MILFDGRPRASFVSAHPEGAKKGLPPRIYLPFVLIFAILFLGTMAYLVNIGFGVSGSVFGKAITGSAGAQSAQQRVEGGPPPAVMLEWQSLQRRVALHPHDDVTLTQLGDLELTAGRYRQAISYYRRALAANPHNAAAQEGLGQAQDALHPTQ
jgi:tetratricopeptide (TPR) repeat protein